MRSAPSSTDPVDDGDAVSRVIAATGASLARRSHVVAVLRHPLVGEGLTVYAGPAGLAASMHWTGPHPSQAVLNLAAEAGSAVTGDPAWLLRPTIARCHAAALQAITAAVPNATADGFAVGCAEIDGVAFTHDGGGGGITISLRS